MIIITIIIIIDINSKFNKITALRFGSSSDVQVFVLVILLF